MSSIDLRKLEKTKPESDDASLLNRFSQILNKDIRFPFNKSINDTFKERFYAELSLLLREGIDLKSALIIILEESETETITNQVRNIQQQIVNGEKFANAIKSNPNFTSYEYYSIAIGEESGRLIEVLKELSVYFHRKVKLKRQLTSALIYPSIVLAVALGAITFMLNFVVPMFSEVFRRFNGELPAITRFIIQFSLLFKSIFWFLAIALLLLLGVLYSKRNTIWFRHHSSKFILDIPVLGELVRKIYLARFCQSLALLLQSKVSIIQALEMVKNMVNFRPLELTIEPIKQEILKGNSLHNSLAKYPIYTRKMTNMIKVAEDVNKLDEMLGRVSVQLSEETEHQIELFNKLLEPVLIVILGVIVGTILVAMYLPLFQLGSQIGQ